MKAVALVTASLAGCSGDAVSLARPSPTPSSAISSPAPLGRLLFQDNFDGTRLDPAKWRAYAGQPLGAPTAWWSPQHVVVRDGVLSLRGYPERARGGQFVTAGVTSAPGLTLTYGTFLVRFRTSDAAAVTDSLLLWPADDRPPPYVTFAARRARQTNLLFANSVARGRFTDDVVSQSRDLNDLGWHTAGVTWTPSRVIVTLDGRRWADFEGSSVPRIPMVLDLQSQAPPCATATGGGCLSGITGHELLVDWVKVYALPA